MGVGLGWLGWRIDGLGNQLDVATLVVVGIGLGLVGVAWVLGCFGVARRALWTFAVAGVAATVAASLWTFEFALPASLGWNATTTHRARDALAAAARGPLGPTGQPLTPCRIVHRGAIGPLSSPYRVCAGPLTAHLYDVTYFTATRTMGLDFTNVTSGVLPDECARHLVGSWWAFVDKPTSPGDCPFGYRFEPGG